MRMLRENRTGRPENHGTRRLFYQGLPNAAKVVYPADNLSNRLQKFFHQLILPGHMQQDVECQSAKASKKCQRVLPKGMVIDVEPPLKDKIREEPMLNLIEQFQLDDVQLQPLRDDEACLLFRRFRFRTLPHTKLPRSTRTLKQIPHRQVLIPLKILNPHSTNHRHLLLPLYLPCRNRHKPESKSTM